MYTYYFEFTLHVRDNRIHSKKNRTVIKLASSSRIIRQPLFEIENSLAVLNLLSGEDEGHRAVLGCLKYQYNCRAEVELSEKAPLVAL